MGNLPACRPARPRRPRPRRPPSPQPSRKVLVTERASYMGVHHTRFGAPDGAATAARSRAIFSFLETGASRVTPFLVMAYRLSARVPR